MKGITAAALAAVFGLFMLAGCSGDHPVNADRKTSQSSLPSDGGMGGGSGGGSGGY